MSTTPAHPTAIRSYRDLHVWQRATDLVDAVYQLTKEFPGDERYGLVRQLRRAAISIASNIAEGHTRSRADYRRFLVIAAGSLTEVETQLHISIRLSFVDLSAAEPVLTQCGELGRMLSALRRRLATSPQAPAPRP